MSTFTLDADAADELRHENARDNETLDERFAREDAEHEARRNRAVGDAGPESDIALSDAARQSRAVLDDFVNDAKLLARAAKEFGHG